MSDTTQRDTAAPSDTYRAAQVMAPSGASSPTAAQRLSGTGTTGAENTVALLAGAYATLLVGAVAVRIAFGPTNATEASATGPIVGAYGRFDWEVTDRDCFVSIEAADGAAAYEAHVWTSSGPRVAT